MSDKKNLVTNWSIQLLDVVALLEDHPVLGLLRGQVGTVVEVYEPGVFEVEFSDIQGRAYALETLQINELMLLHHRPSHEEALAVTEKLIKALNESLNVQALNNC